MFLSCNFRFALHYNLQLDGFPTLFIIVFATLLLCIVLDTALVFIDDSLLEDREELLFFFSQAAVVRWPLHSNEYQGVSVRRAL